MAKKQYGNVYEIKLSNGKYVYVCWIKQFNFGIFNYLSEIPAELDQLLPLGFKTYKACKETAVRKKIWKLIGYIDLAKENIQYPDLVIYMAYDKDYFIDCSRVMRDGNPIIVPQKDYLALLNKGYIYGFFDKYQTFEEWLSLFIEDYPANYEIAW
jgi:hypothetical protein